jgi:arylsulfatase
MKAQPINQNDRMSRRKVLRCIVALVAAISLLSGPGISALAHSRTPLSQTALKPNIVFLLVDNLGYGEVGVYGGGVTRGAPTPRIDKLSSEGTRLTNLP